jgi:flagellar FliL protein
LAKAKKIKKPKAPKISGDGGADGGKKSKGGLIGAIVTPLILGAASFATVYSLPGGEAAPSAEHDAAPEKPKAEKLYIAKKSAVVELKQFTVSLREDKQVLRIMLALETPESNMENIDPNDLRLRDAFMSYLRAVEMAHLKDAAFLPQLRAQLLRRAKLILGDDKVSGILITEFLIR